MRAIIAVLIIACLGLGFRAALKTIKPPNGEQKKGMKATSSGFAVVELFTSEGCSSCPPADKILAALQQEYDAGNVYILAYHVDYWDRLGWKDAFSNSAYSERQYQYASRLNLQSVYTPQVIINGTREFVGSDESNLRSVIAGDLGQASPIDFQLKTESGTTDEVLIGYSLHAPDANTSIIFSLVERSATTKVLKGENMGRELHHVQIVRAQQTLPPIGTGTASFKIPAGTSKNQFEVIAFLQNTKTGQITGASRLRFE